MYSKNKCLQVLSHHLVLEICNQLLACKNTLTVHWSRSRVPHRVRYNTTCPQKLFVYSVTCSRAGNWALSCCLGEMQHLAHAQVNNLFSLLVAPLKLFCCCYCRAGAYIALSSDPLRSLSPSSRTATQEELHDRVSVQGSPQLFW